MRKSLCVFLLVLVTLAFGVTLAVAQSSGNFSATVATTQCLINEDTGALGSSIATLLSTTIKTPNSGGTALVIRPSLVTGLFTKNKLTGTTTADYLTQSSTSTAGVQVRVLFDGKIVAPGIPAGVAPNDADDDPTNDGWVYYDKRWVQMSSNIFNSALAGAACDNPTTANPDGSPLIEPCFLELIISTLSAHSFDFLVGGEAGGVGGGDHTVEVEWRLDPATNNSETEAACVGPGVLTVEQVKLFNTGGGIVVEP